MEFKLSAIVYSDIARNDLGARFARYNENNLNSNRFICCFFYFDINLWAGVFLCA